MKKISVLIGLILLTAKLFAISDFQIKTFQRWRSSETATPDTYVSLATGCPCIIHDVTVTSGSVGNAGASFQYFGSTVGNLSQTGFSKSSSTIYDMDLSGDRFDIDDVVTSTDVFYTKTSSTAIRVRWDWYLGPPKGLEAKGLK